MAEKIIQLDADEIVNKKFNVDFRGYAPVEVGRFLNTIARDYMTYDEIILELKDEIRKLQEEKLQLKGQLRDLEEKSKAPVSNNGNGELSMTQLDIIRRLSRLEEAVFKNR